MSIFKRKKMQPQPTDAALPQHVALIMDGNGRWAKKRGLPRSAGHRAGADNFKKIVKCKLVLRYNGFPTQAQRNPNFRVCKIVSKVI